MAQLCLTLCDPMFCSLPGSSILWIFLARVTGEDCHFLLQGIFPTQGLNPHLPHCRQMLYRLSHQGSLSIYVYMYCFSSVQSFGHVRLFATPWTAARQASVHHQLPEFTQLMSIKSVMPSNHLILCCSLLLPPSVFPSIRVFSDQLVLHIR